MHNPINDYHGFTRRMHRITLAGDLPADRPDRRVPRRVDWRATPGRPQNATCMPPTTAAELFVRNADRDDVAAHFEDRSYSWRELAAESRRRAALWAELRDPDAPPHIGVLLDNTAEYLFWLGAAAITPLGDRRHQRDVPGRRARTARRPHRLPGAGHVRRVRRAARRRAEPGARPTACCTPAPTTTPEQLDGASTPTRARRPAEPDDLYLLIFTSGSTGVPEGGALHAGPLRAHGRAREERRRARSGHGGVRAAPVLPLELAVHRVGERAAGGGAVRRAGRGSRRRTPCPTSAAWAPRCSPTRARS